MAQPFRPEDLTPEARAAYERMMNGKPKAQPQAPQAAPAPVQTQQQPTADIPKVKRNIKRLLEQNAPEEDIDAYVESEGVTFEQLKAHKSQPAELAWSDVPGKAFNNLGPSAARVAYNIVYPFLHPIDTATAFKNIGVGAVSKAKGALGFEQDPENKAANEAHINAVGQFFLDRYGSIEGLKKTLAEDPVGAMADASVVLSGGGAAAARVPGVVGKAGQAASRAGSMLDPIANAGRAVKATGKLASEGIGLATGTGGLPIEYAFKAGQKGSTTFADNMRGQAPITDTLDMAQSAVKDFGRARSDAYVKGMEQINASNKALDLRPVAKAIEDGAGMVYYNGVAKSTEAADTIKKIVSKFEEFNALPPAAKNSPKGVDALKQAIGEIRQTTDHGTVSRTVANNVYNTAKEQIVKQLPEYAQTMKGYSQASEQLDDITKTLSLGENAAKDTGIRKLTSVMRNNVNTNYGRRAQLVDELAKYQPELPYAVAGQSLNSLAPRGLSRLPAGLTAAAGVGTFNPMVLPALAASSPRLMGEAAYGAGKAVGSVEKIARALGVDVKTAAQIMRKSYAASQGTQPTLIGSQTGDYPTP